MGGLEITTASPQNQVVFSSKMEATMQTSLKALLVGAAAVATAFSVTPAVARDAQEHVLTIQLPGGGIEEIHYTGDVAPQVVLAPIDAITLPSGLISMGRPSADMGAFAAFERISSLLDQQAAAMLQQVADMPFIVGPSQLPADAHGYSIVFSSNGACTQTTQITYMGNGVKPRTVSSTSGKCGPGTEGRIPAELHFTPSPAGVDHVMPRTLEVKAQGQQPFGKLVREAALKQTQQGVD